MNTSYLYEDDTNIPFFRLAGEVEHMILEYTAEMEAAQYDIEMLQYFGEDVSDAVDKAASKNKSFLQKIGEKVQAIIAKLKAIMDKMFGAFKKSEKELPKESEMKAMFQSHPEYAESFLNGLKSGTVKFCDYKDLEALIDAAEDAVKQLDSGKLEEKTFSDKMDDIMKKVDEKLQSPANIVKSLTIIAGGVFGVTKAINMLKEQKVKGAEMKLKLDKMNENIIKDLADETTGDNGATEKFNGLSKRLMVSNRLSMECGKTSEWLGNKIDWCVKWFGKHAPGDKTDFASTLAGKMSGDVDKDGNPISKIDKKIAAFSKVSSVGKGGGKS